MYKGVMLAAVMSSTGLVAFHSNIAINRIDFGKDTAALQEFESQFRYPFSSTEEFSIKHGIKGDYSAFFKSLGKPYYYMATAKKDKKVTKIINGEKTIVQQKAGEVAAALCGVLRKVKTRDGKNVPAWYFCDLKVGQKYQGEHIPLWLRGNIILRNLWKFIRCPRGFGICMNPAEGEPKAASISKNHGWFRVNDTKILNLYTLSADQVERERPALKAILVRRGYMQPDQELMCASTQGMKDYEIRNTITGEARPWQLFHIRPGVSQQAEALHKDGTYMISAVEGTPLDADFRKVVGQPSSTAQIVSYNMKNVDFNWLTSNQI